MAKISIVTSGHFSTNPRVWREADALAKARHAVTVVGVSYDPFQFDMDQDMLRSRSWRYRAAADLRPVSGGSRLRNRYERLHSRWGRIRSGWGWPDPASLGYAVHALADAALHERADLTILHLEPALWVGTQLCAQSLPIGMDLEDWYSENRPAGVAQWEIHYLRRLEKEVVPAAVHLTTTSRGMAESLSKDLGVSTPEVIYNSALSPARVSTSPALGPLRLVWFSQTIGPGRGLEDLFAALPQLEGDWVLEIRGRSPVETDRWLNEQLPSAIRGRISIEPLVPPDQLGKVISRHEVGLVLDPPWCRNKDLTISNKLLQYLQEGLSVVAADTSGTREVQSILPGAVQLYAAGQTPSLVGILNQLIRQRTAVIASRESIHQQANTAFAYEQQAPRLLASVDRALMRNRA